MPKVQATVIASKERVERVGAAFETFTLEVDSPVAPTLKEELQRIGADGQVLVYGVYTDQADIRMQAKIRLKAEAALKKNGGKLPDGFQAELQEEISDWKPSTSEGRSKKSSQEKATESFDKMSLEQQEAWLAAQREKLAQRKSQG